MVQILQNKKTATVFQILVEVARSQPNIPQKLIAAKIGVTPQAVSEHIRELTRQGYLESPGRSRYRISPEGVNFILKMAGEIEEYSAQVAKAVTRIAVTTALAKEDIASGQKVKLYMHDGLLHAAGTGPGSAQGTAISNAREGEDVGVSHLEGIVALEPGKVTVAVVPGIEKGGSKVADLGGLKKLCRRHKMILTVGLEALAALRKIGIEPACLYAPIPATIEATQAGLSPLMVCAETELNNLSTKLSEANLKYFTADLTKTDK